MNNNLISTSARAFNADSETNFSVDDAEDVSFQFEDDAPNDVTVLTDDDVATVALLLVRAPAGPTQSKFIFAVFSSSTVLHTGTQSIVCLFFD
jgi:hypothetical protein